MIQDPFLIEELLKNLLYLEITKSREPSVFLFLPSEKEYFRGFFTVLKGTGNISVYQLLYLVKNPLLFENDESYNLKVLSYIFPMLLSAVCDYHAFYSYRDFAFTGDLATGFPYYIIFSGHILLLTPDLGAAWMETSPQLLSFMKSRLSNIIRQSRELAVQQKNPTEYLQKTLKLYKSAGFQYSIEYQPCLLPFLGEELADAIINPLLPERNALKSVLSKCCDQFYELEKNLVLFIQEGLEQFADDGLIINAPPSYARACRPKERLDVLRRIKAAVKSDTVVMRCINTANLPMKGQFYLSLQRSGAVNFFSYNFKSRDFRMIEIQENTIYSAFADFLGYLPKTYNVCTKNETLRIVRNYIDKAAGKIEKENR